MSEYFTISYEQALDYLKTLSKGQINYLKYQYNTDDIEELANIVSDKDLINLGFVPNEKTIEDIDYKYPVINDICEYLINLDEDTLYNLMNKYDCCNIDDLAIAITDSELDFLGYCKENCSSVNEKKQIKCDFDYDEDFDYLEDVPYDTEYEYLYSNDQGDYFIFDEDYDYDSFKCCLDSNIVDTCDIIDENFNNKKVVRVQKHKYPVSEEVIINKTLNPAIFDEQHKMLPEIREQLLKYISDFADSMSKKDVKINYIDAYLIGSNAGYLYTPESDIDVHIISADILNPIDAENLFTEFDIYETENPLFINGSKVELGIEDNYNIIMDNLNARQYSIFNDEWVNDSDKFEIFSEEDITKVEGYENIVEKYTQRINNVVDNDSYNEALLLKQEIRQNRSDDLANIGALSMGNIVFKELRNNGSYKKLRDYIRDKELGDVVNE